jgi:phage tail sheath protein FI
MCGVMAARATTRGAWIAPANEPLRDVLGLSPAIPREQRQLLYETQVNLIRQEPHGFVVMSADTLSTDPDLIPINVRRLLALIRRIALREGPTFVFEPSSDVFRRAVERQFEVLLGDMFRAGAFAGDSPSSSFQVDVDTSINTDTSVDQGRFIVELRVAPSLPLGFITVRLVQASGLGQVTEGA